MLWLWPRSNRRVDLISSGTARPISNKEKESITGKQMKKKRKRNLLPVVAPHLAMTSTDCAAWWQQVAALMGHYCILFCCFLSFFILVKKWQTEQQQVCNCCFFLDVQFTVNSVLASAVVVDFSKASTTIPFVLDCLYFAKTMQISFTVCYCHHHH